MKVKAKVHSFSIETSFIDKTIIFLLNYLGSFQYIFYYCPKSISLDFLKFILSLEIFFLSHSHFQVNFKIHLYITDHCDINWDCTESISIFGEN